MVSRSAAPGWAGLGRGEEAFQDLKCVLPDQRAGKSLAVVLLCSLLCGITR